jgi:hypothetical protein
MCAASCATVSVLKVCSKITIPGSAAAMNFIELCSVFVLAPASSVTAAPSSLGCQVLQTERSWHSKPTVYTSGVPSAWVRCVYSSKAETELCFATVLACMSEINTSGKPFNVKRIFGKSPLRSGASDANKYRSFACTASASCFFGALEHYIDDVFGGMLGGVNATAVASIIEHRGVAGASAT